MAKVGRHQHVDCLDCLCAACQFGRICAEIAVLPDENQQNRIFEHITAALADGHCALVKLLLSNDSPLCGFDFYEIDLPDVLWQQAIEAGCWKCYSRLNPGYSVWHMRQLVELNNVAAMTLVLKNMAEADKHQLFFYDGCVDKGVIHAAKALNNTDILELLVQFGFDRR